MKTVTDTVTQMPRVLLHCIIPGEPKSWERVGWRRGRAYNPNSEAKSRFLWQVKAATPMLAMDCVSRLGARFEFWIGAKNAWTQDLDNLAKQLLDTLTGTVWKDDRQIDEIYARVHRGATAPQTEILIYETFQEQS